MGAARGGGGVCRPRRTAAARSSAAAARRLWLRRMGRCAAPSWRQARPAEARWVLNAWPSSRTLGVCVWAAIGQMPMMEAARSSIGRILAPGLAPRARCWNMSTASEAVSVDAGVHPFDFRARAGRGRPPVGIVFGTPIERPRRTHPTQSSSNSHRATTSSNVTTVLRGPHGSSESARLGSPTRGQRRLFSPYGRR